MYRDEILSEIKVSFQPLCLSLPDETILQKVDWVIRYWNNFSAYRTLNMYDAAPVITLSNIYKDVVQVLPSAQAAAIGLADPTWTLLGIQVMNYLTSDYIAINEGYKNYRSYFGTDFRFQFEPNPDPTLGGKLYCSNIPNLATKLAVIGTKRITTAENITDDFILDFILRASIAHVKMAEGSVLRKASIIKIANDGQPLVDEGKEEWDKLKDELGHNSKWFCFGQRI